MELNVFNIKLCITRKTNVNWLTCLLRILRPQQVFHQRVCQSVVHVEASCQAACQLVDDPPPDLPAAGILSDPAAPAGGPSSSRLQNRHTSVSTTLIPTTIIDKKNTFNVLKYKNCL